MYTVQLLGHARPKNIYKRAAASVVTPPFSATLGQLIEDNPFWRFIGVVSMTTPTAKEHMPV